MCVHGFKLELGPWVNLAIACPTAGPTLAFLGNITCRKGRHASQGLHDPETLVVGRPRHAGVGFRIWETFLRPESATRPFRGKH